MTNRYLFLAVALSLLLVFSCTDDMAPNMGAGDSLTAEITAYSVGNVATKTGLAEGEGGKKNVVWKSGNAISLFFNQGEGGGDKFTTTSSGPIAKFTGTISAVSGDLSDTGGKAYFWGLYPYNANASCDGSAVTTTLASRQLAYKSDIADDLLVTVGRSENLAIYFKNTCAVVAFTLSQDNISKITFSGNNNEKISGEFKASFDLSNKLVVTPTANAVKRIEITPAETGTFEKGKTYYFVFLPQRFSAGYTLTFTRNDGYTASFVRSTDFTFAISTFYTMTNKDNGLVFSPQQEMVDLGLSVKWATCNLGSTSPDEFGNYYAWGEITPKLSYSWSNYAWGTNNNAITKYNASDGKVILDAEDDAVSALFGNGWRIPSKEEMDELYNNCTRVYTTENGVSGFKFISTVKGYEGASIFLPCTDKERANRGYYWSTRVNSGNGCSSSFVFDLDGATFEQVFRTDLPRYVGASIRPVFGSQLVSPPNTEIWYKTSTGVAVSLPSGNYDFGSSFVSNTYVNGMGIIKCDGAITKIPSRLFDDKPVTEIQLPYSIQEIGSYAFEGTSISTIALPESLATMGSGVFEECNNLLSISGKFSSADGKKLIVNENGTCVMKAFIIGEATSISVSKDDVDIVDYGAFIGDCDLVESFYCDCVIASVPSLSSAVNVSLPVYIFADCPFTDNPTIGSYINTTSLNTYDLSYIFPKVENLTLINIDQINNGDGIRLCYSPYESDRHLKTLTLPDVSFERVDHFLFQTCLSHGCKIYGPHASSDHTCWIVNGDLQLFSFPDNTHYYQLPSSVTKINTYITWSSPFSWRVDYLDEAYYQVTNNYEHYYAVYHYFLSNNFSFSLSDNETIEHECSGNYGVIIPETVTEIYSPLLFRIPTFFKSSTPPQLSPYVTFYSSVDYSGSLSPSFIFVPSSYEEGYSAAWNEYLSSSIHGQYVTLNGNWEEADVPLLKIYKISSIPDNSFLGRFQSSTDGYVYYYEF